MKKLLAAWLLLVLLPLGVTAQTADAIVVAPRTAKLTAPFAGTLLPFDAVQGDSVSAGETLFTFDESPVYATQDGTLDAVFARVGDDAAGLIARYGGLAAMEPTNALYIDASNKDAHDDAQSKWLHAGETLYLKKGNDKGVGRVTQVNGNDYIVEILSGPFEVDDTVRCYRESAYSNDSETGRGKVRRYGDVRVVAEGRVASVHCRAGDAVKIGDLLFTLRDAAAPKDAVSEVISPVAGAITRLAVVSGQQVARGQLLCEIADLSTLELSCDLDELDFASVHVGDALSYTLDAYGDRVFTGTVLSLRPLGEKRTNATYFDLRISLPTDVVILPGMNGTVRIGE